MRGRKPKPTHLKLVTGVRKSRINQAEPKFDPDLPMPPPFLSDEAKVEWGRVSEHLYRVGILTVVDRAVLAAYCDSYSILARASLQMREYERREASPGASLALTTINGNVIQNVMLGIINKAKADLVRYAAELGMTPSARSRVPADREKDRDPASKYIA